MFNVRGQLLFCVFWKITHDQSGVNLCPFYILIDSDKYMYLYKMWCSIGYEMWGSGQNKSYVAVVCSFLKVCHLGCTFQRISKCNTRQTILQFFVL